jgi:DNA-binding NarL/FixJ family response regulator
MQLKIDTLPISKREQDVLKLMLKGKTNKEISKELGICVGTTKAHVSRIFDKTDCRNRSEIILKCIT